MPESEIPEMKECSFCNAKDAAATLTNAKTKKHVCMACAVDIHRGLTQFMAGK